MFPIKLGLNINNDQNHYIDKISYQKSYWTIKCFDITSTDTFAEKDAMMVHISHAYVTVFTMFHIFGNILITFDTIEYLFLLTFFCFSHFIRWHIIISHSCICQSLIKTFSFLKWATFFVILRTIFLIGIFSSAWLFVNISFVISLICMLSDAWVTKNSHCQKYQIYTN